MQETDEPFLRQAIALARNAGQRGADPFGALLVVNGHLVYQTEDHSVDYSDPTAHAELCAISEYCRTSHRFHLHGYTLYTSTEPCVMCAGAIHWARISRVVFSVSLSTLHQLSGGKSKAKTETLLRRGSHTVELVGPLLESEGITAFEGHTFNTKAARHQVLFPPDQ
ncbi:nucleoside deaminase [Ktedonosporobacter rubrisoli]|uniref:Nucleoside deaminase n=1 Tax=Ktedonosporobacter rubrisoli TaxID=2509675 RepID=A0A4P6JPB3_KTERU|nr:nucleoside deaminase [Ktedonosporobacter rubrisoli]QBD77043.1 nucleoside deaminase [Ktedonosporobacter rubrisoli]